MKDFSHSTPHPPEDFAALLAGNKPLFIVGGQAVNLWALYYSDYTSELIPFVSADLDILGDKTTLTNIAKKTGLKPHFFPMRPPTNEVGVIIAKNAGGQLLPIEVLSSVHGIKNEELRQNEYTFRIGENDTIVKLPGPIALLQAKIANVADIPQEGRQDERHVRILCKLMPAYLKDISKNVDKKRIKEREMLNMFELLLKIITGKKGKKVLENLKIDRLSMFSELTPTSPSKLDLFITQRLPRLIT